jgi:hypothetical protein
MTGAQRSLIVAVFNDHNEADRAVDELRRAGFRNDQIGMVSRDPNTGKATTRPAKDKGVSEGTGAAVGAVAGAVAGAGIGGAVALGILAGVIPGIGPAIAAGTLGVVLANAAGGAAIAGVAGALIGLGVSEEEARHYEGEFKAGRTLVTVHNVGNRFDEAWNILRRHGAYSRETAAAGTPY